MPFSIRQQKSLAVAPKVTGSMSIIGSLCIMRAVQGDMKNGEAGTYHRLLLGLSAFDVIGSFATILSTWPMPRETPGVWGAVGNTSTCTAQGFMLHFVSAGALYNASVSIYFLLRCRYNWSDDRLRKVEPYMHCIPVANTIGTGLAALPLKLFNNANLWCWIAPFPSGCKDSFRYGEEGNCIRGDNAWIYRIGFFFAQVWLSIVIAMVAMILIYYTVRGHEKAIDNVQEENVSVKKQSRRVANQAFLYMMAFYLVWVPPSMLRLLQTIPRTTVKVTFPLVLFLAVVSPLQGLFNSAIFFRSRFLRYRRAYPCHTIWKSYKSVVFGHKLGTVLSQADATQTDKVFMRAKLDVSQRGEQQDTSRETESKQPNM